MLVKKLSVIALVGALFSSFNAVAWGQNGHRIIGKVAEEHLTTATVQALTPLLEESSLAQVSTWADEMRSNDSEFWRKKSTKWHYINVKDATKMHSHIDHSINSKEQVKNILDGIYYSINTLQSDATSIDEKRFALRFLVHLVGDSHQPFHAGRGEDHGGNLIKVTFFGDKTNLHSTWDTRLIENERLSYSEFAEFIKTSNKTIISDYLNSEPADWLLESHHISDKVYNLNETEISYGYIYKYMPTVRIRLQQGGIRLAGLLNQIFDKNAAPLKEALKTSNVVAVK
ncbi:S1/P1 Nuclease [Pseudoalteromonas citrea]|uniref:S1/P1 Nuclease n=1 Tax=Pseudoalteromonas citrea TaxID=43655 RepID=A0A5S3XRJ0_9GAMM|nr:S1/P1 nuclease [Pseudoalteromonas citrea]TMP42558.1 S1/P1 Nuclease [Pseudoalteromonas citrea]TMP59264.1 S1/P1 Nuclease [Pseudoalteromonas citrea]